MAIQGHAVWHANGVLAPGHRLGQALRFSCPVLPILRCRRPSMTVFRGHRVAVRSQYAAPNAQRSAALPMLAARKPPSPDDIFFARSYFMDKEIITRTGGRRLGYVSQLYVDPARLQVVALYLRPELLALRSNSTDHVHLRNIVQIGDVVLVHDEQALMEPPANEAFGYYRMVGAVVKTEGGMELGKVRDFLFNPDDGSITSIAYDAVGIPRIPQVLLTTYQLGWQDIVAMGPAEVIVRRGAEQRALKINDGLIGESISNLVSILSTTEERTGDAENFRDDAAYREWYAQHGKAYEQYSGQKMPAPTPPTQVPAAPPASRRATAPRALPPPQSQSYDQVFQAQPPQQQQAGQPWRVATETREAVPAGWGAAGAPPPMQPPRTPPPQQQARQPQGLAEVQFPQPRPRQPSQQAMPQQPPPGRPSAGPGMPRRPPAAAPYPPPGPYPEPGGALPRPAQQQPQPQQGWAGQPPARRPPATAPARPPNQWAEQGPPTAAARAVEPDAVIAGGYQRAGNTGRAPLQQAEFSAPQAPSAQAAAVPPPNVQGPPQAQTAGLQQHAPQQFGGQQQAGQDPSAYQRPPPQ